MEKTIAQQLNVKTFPFYIQDDNEKTIYYEDSSGKWCKSEFDDNGNIIYSEDDKGYWRKWEYNDKGKRIYYEDSDGYWSKWEDDDNGKEIYTEGNDGKIIDNRPKSIPEYTMEELTVKLGHNFKIKK